MMGWKMESSLFGRFVINLVFLTVFLYVSSPPLRSLSHISLSLSFSVFCSESSMETDVMRKKQETGPCFVRQARSPKIVIMLRTVKRPITIKPSYSRLEEQPRKFLIIPRRVFPIEPSSAGVCFLTWKIVWSRDCGKSLVRFPRLKVSLEEVFSSSYYFNYIISR